MKISILLILSFLCLFSCNQKPETSENQSVENQKIKAVENKLPNFNAYTSVQLDSFFQIYRDSLINFISKNKFDKDTTIRNDFIKVTYGMAANDFPAFAFIDNNSCHLKADFDCYFFLYAEKDGVFELIEKSKDQDSFPYDWSSSEIERRDINFDGKIDVLIKRPCFSASREITDYVLITNPNFKKIETIFTTDSLPTNPKNKTVISFSDGGNSYPHHKIINKWQSDSLVEIRHLEKVYNYKEEKFILEEFILKNGKEIKIKTQKLKSDKAELYFESYK